MSVARVRVVTVPPTAVPVHAVYVCHSGEKAGLYRALPGVSRCWRVLFEMAWSKERLSVPAVALVPVRPDIVDSFGIRCLHSSVVHHV